MSTTIPSAAGIVTATPAMKRPTLLMSFTADLERNRAKREDGRDPEADEDALLLAAREPQRDGEDERGERGDEDRSGRAEAMVRCCT